MGSFLDLGPQERGKYEDRTDAGGLLRDQMFVRRKVLKSTMVVGYLSF